MELSPRRFFRRPRLYHAASGLAVLAVLLVSPVLAQFGRKTRASKGPRATGLVLVQPNGKARLIPVAIMVDGKFYDASSYKADPVPMALDFGVVYEAFRTGVSQGLLTITQPGHLRHTWIAEGTWLPAGAKPARTHLKAETPNTEEKDAPPRLHRPTDKGNPSSAADKGSASTSGDKPAATSSTPEKPATLASTSGQQKSADKTPSTSEVDLNRPIDDPNRPVLRRGRPDPNVRREQMKDFDETEPAPSAAALPSAHDPVLAKMIPAVSDAGGPDTRSYAYDTKSSEEAAFRTKMLDMASAELQRANPAFAPKRAATVAQKASHISSVRTRSARTPTPAPKVEFTDVQLRIFDLSSSNEPVLVLTAQAPAPIMPSKPAMGSENASEPPRVPALPQEITLIARTNLEGELHKLFFSATDAQHLDVAPRMELIDAVDADGDGRGELLFRRTTDEGSSYGIYRVTADQLWPLYEGTP